jgi:hypothetical protein
MITGLLVCSAFYSLAAIPYIPGAEATATATHMSNVTSSVTKPGGIFVTGHDADYHAVRGHNAIGAQHIIQRAVSFVTSGKNHPKILLVTDLRNPGGDESDPRLGIKAAAFPVFDVADYGSNTSGVLNLKNVNFTNYDAIIVSSDNGGWLRQDELNVLNARANDIREYVIHGGGIITLSESGIRTTHDQYAFIPTSGMKISDMKLGEMESSMNLTHFGKALGLQNNDVTGNCLHNAFATSSNMNIVDVDRSGHIISLASLLKR